MDITLTVNYRNDCFPLPLNVRWVDGKLWELLSPFEYHRKNGEIIRVEKGTLTDFGSKPKITWLFVGSPTDEGGPAYVIHDDLCEKQPYPYFIIDKIFYEALRDLGIPYLKRTLMYWAVSAFHIFKP